MSLSAAVSGAMEGGPGNETSQLSSSPVASAQNQDSVIASYKELIKEQVKRFYNDVKRGFQDDTRNLIGSAIMKVLFKPIKFRITSRFPRLTSL